MKTLTDIARSIAQQAEHTPNADIDELCENYVTNRQEEVLAAYLANPEASLELIGALTSLKDASSAREVTKIIGTITDELDDALFDATEMIAYRVDCILDHEPGFECPKE
uniref:Uncharacterized protein n=1 Tax=Podoviridae sp. ctiwu7 TaxID=2825269 RepID=A0A8S5QCL2_9CAUD|nr:MAG TPA: hypothetical protein [Podoviridae sp. ctiwu7]